MSYERVSYDKNAPRAHALERRAGKLTGGGTVAKKKKLRFLLYLLPGLTMLTVSGSDLSAENLSVLGGRPENRIGIGLWGMAAGYALFCFMKYLFRLDGGPHKGANCFLISAAVLFAVSFALPYVPEKAPFVSSLHVKAAFFSTMSFLAGLVCFLHSISKKHPGRLSAAWMLFGCQSAFALAILYQEGFITSLLEIFIIASVCMYLLYLEQLLICFARTD
jgi:hypothetical protein